MSETIVLDPSAVATSRTAVDITNFISVEGVDWGDAEITAYLAAGHVGSTPVDYDIPNRTVTIPLVLKTVGATSFDTIRAQIQAKVGLFQREGGWISRQTSVGTMYADVISATLKMGGDWLQAFKSVDIDAVLTLELRPDWYGAEVTLDDKTETTALALTTVLKLTASDAVIKGDYPGRVRMVVDEDQGQSQLGLIWGYRSRYYDNASTAALTYEAEALTPLDVAGTTPLSGASGGTVMTHATVRTDWTGVLSTRMLAGTANLTHKGTYRCWARCYSTSTTLPDVRLVWQLGDFVNPTENTRKSIPSVSNFHWLDLGEIRLDPIPTGMHQWIGQIHALGGTANSNVSVDAVHFVPIDDGYGVLRAPQIVPTITAYTGLDSFTSTAAGTALNGRVAPTGGTWATSGDATDFAFADDLSGEQVKRSATSGTNGRFAILGTTSLSGVQVEAVVVGTGGPTATNEKVAMGVIARWTDASNYVRGTYTVKKLFGSHSQYKVEIYQLVAGVETLIATGALSTPSSGRLRLAAYASGLVTCQLLDSTTGAVLATASGASAATVTGGALASGKCGIFDRYTDTPACDRYYDDFRFAALPTIDATIYPNQSVELRTEGIYRKNTAGTAFANAPHVGVLPRIPPSGLESRKVELYIKASRGDFDQTADTAIDDISCQVFYRPTWLLIPGS